MRKGPIFLLFLFIIFAVKAISIFVMDPDLSKEHSPYTDVEQQSITAYSDCISGREVAVYLTKYNVKMETIEKPFLTEINNHIESYKASIDSTIKNLSSADAHHFIHMEFSKCKQQLDSDSLSRIKIHFYRNILQFCYEMDLSLNGNTIQ